MMQCRKVQHVIVPSYATRNSLLHYGFDTDKITVIHHGVDPGVFRKNGSRDYVRKKYGISNHFVLVTVGKLIKRKRQIDIINALSGINDAALILVGKGEEESDIKRTARDKQVMLLHFKQVPERVLVDLYNAADAYVHSSVLEGFGLTILEAMACGLPIITYKTGDFTEIVRKAGIILQPSDVKGMRDTILRLKKKPNERALMSQLAQEESAKYTWDKTVKAHLNVYLRLMGE
jgi:glycosyltransferase involved in cell wall biosynthesis